MQKRKRVQFETTGPSRTQQHLKDSTNVNSILERYRRTGLISHTRTTPGSYGDFTHMGDFKSNLDRVIQAQAAFDALPAQLRKRFQNDPAELIQFVSDDKNYEEAVKLGFVVPRSEVPPKPNQNDDKTTKPGSSEPSATTTPPEA